MATYQLQITTINGVKTLPLSLDQTIELEAGENTKYQILDESGELVSDLNTTTVGQNDLAVHLGQAENPSVIIKNYYHTYPIESGAYLEEVSASFATASKEAPFVLASEVTGVATSGAVSFSTIALYGAGALAATVGTVAVARSGDSGGEKVVEKAAGQPSAEVPKAEEPAAPINVTIKLDTVTQDNILNATERQDEVEISGTFSADQDFTSAQVTLFVGELSVPAQVDGNRFSAKVSGAQLAENGKVVANVVLANEKSSGTARDEQPYQVDTQITAPTITLNPVTKDNVLNLSESQQAEVVVSGKVTNVEHSAAKVGDTVTIKVGDEAFTTTLIEKEGELRFEQAVSGDLLAKNSKIRVTVATTDAILNTLNSTTEQAYEQDLVIADPNIIFDEITADNAINIVESGLAEIVLSGKVENVPNSEAKAGDRVVISVGDTQVETHLIEKNGELRFEKAVSGELLAKNDPISATLFTQDTAENRAETVKSKEYRVDTLIAAPTLTINKISTDDIINAVEKRAETILVSGSAANGENAEAKPNDIVELRIGELVVPARLSEQLTFEVPVSTIALVNHKTITATLVTQDRAENRISATAEKTITVDETLNLSVAITQVDQDNLINIADTAKPITLTGTFTADDDVKAESVKVSVLLNGVAHLAEVDVQARSWSLTVAGSELVNGQGENTITANITAEDQAGNAAEASSPYSYQVDTEIGKPVVKITSIAEDDVIDATEAKGSITIRGIVENYEGNNPVTLLCPCAACHGGWKEVEAQVVDGKFEVAVVVSETSLADAKLKSEERKIKAKFTSKDPAGNEAAADEASRGYDLDLGLQNEIDITRIGNAFEATPTMMTRIYGKVEEFENITYSGRKFNWYNVGQNSRILRTATLVIGDQKYKVGFKGKDKTFQVDIRHDELANLVGKPISLNFDDDVNYNNQHTRIYGNIGTAIYSHAEKAVAKRFTLSGDLIEQTGANSYSLKAVNDKTEISGTVKGPEATVGKTVEVKVGEKTFTTTVQDGNTFSLEVDTQILRDNPSQVVSATLKDVEQPATDQEIYLNAAQNNGNFVSQHGEIARESRVIDPTKENYNFFYPIHLLEAGGSAQRGFHSNYQVGGTDSPLTIKYHFTLGNEIDIIPRNQITGAGYAREILGFEQDTVLQNTFRQAYKVIEKYTNLKFEETANYEEVINGKGSLITLAYLTPEHNGASAYAGSGSGIIWNRSVNSPASSGSDFAFYTALHEIGHTLHMVHLNEPFDANGFGQERSTAFSNMSYSPEGQSLQMRDVRLYDMAYLHYRFGVNRSHRAGNDVYTFKNYNGRSADGDVYIWDGDGVDTFDASNEKEGVTVNLTPGSWNYRGEARSNSFLVKEIETYDRAAYFGLPSDAKFTNGFALSPADKKSFNSYYEGQSFIGYGTQIENLIGSKFADKLTGNNADNNIFGGAGDDVIAGGLGNDFINGGEGDDMMFGGEGNDTYVVDSVADVVTEEADQGTDHVYSLVDYTLDNNVENLTLIGTTAKNATGNELGNIIRGNDSGNTINGMAGDDTLIGGLGKDTLTGGEGRDTFVFDSALNGKTDTITDFVRGEDKIQLSKVVFSAINEDLSNLSQHLFYDAASGTLSYNGGNSGETDAVSFVTVSGLGSIDNSVFILA